MMPKYSSAIWTAIAPSIANHLWQSTVVTLIAWLLALALRKNQARTRYWVWMIASLKFLLPFSLLIAAGESLRSTLSAPVQQPALDVVMEQITQPFPPTAFHATLDDLSAMPIAAPHHSGLLPFVLLAVWLCGVLAIASSWVRSWWQIRAAARAALPMTSLGGVPVLSSPAMREPGVFGILRPVLLMPEKISDHLSAPQLNTIIAHEMCHIGRRDNLTAALHMAVVAAFWFHPAVWWIKARLLEEREQACDEAVLHLGNGAQLYAESILNVCKYYVEGPRMCMSGVTGSDLKRRIVRIMSEQAARQLGFGRKVLLCVAGLATVTVPIVFGWVHITQVRAQSAAENAASGIAGTWQGTLHPGRDLRTVVKISKTDDGEYKAVFYSIDQGGDGVPVTKITLDGNTLKMTLAMVGGSYEGKLSPDANTITGTWTQGPSLPLNLTGATPQTEWTIPPPSPKIPPMDATASPGIEVATIKPTKPDEQGFMLVFGGGRFQTKNISLSKLLAFSYGVQQKQLVGLPSWADTDKYDIDAKPDTEGTPDKKQLQGMVQKLIADRFSVTFHREKRELPVYVLSVGKTGSKISKSEDPSGLPGFGLRGMGDVMIHSATMSDFAGMMQETVLDRPVLDQTGLDGRYDFTLRWTPDDSQFGGMPAKMPPPTDNSSPPPNLYTAIQEQTGLKLDATKAPADVMIIDHVAKPSEN
jgi:uncharacterized protein (TIGR03435 family)